MSKEPIMTDFLKELKLITESTHDKDVRNSVNILTNFELRKQGWVDEDFEFMGKPEGEIARPSFSELFLVERDGADGLKPFTSMYRTLKRAKGGHPDNKLYRFKFDCELKNHE